MRRHEWDIKEWSSFDVLGLMQGVELSDDQKQVRRDALTIATRFPDKKPIMNEIVTVNAFVHLMSAWMRDLKQNEELRYVAKQFVTSHGAEVWLRSRTFPR